ncbi:hypothetical protein [Streptomyces sp. MP131-18]|uniref:hypothetical protein n=1 Tax=Streptomyces sp. MP131-18 TaxID=1857892 RepID=UPI00097C5D24|nr:hypothetical protein [Streptomyces sp. MP131-18]
MERPSFTEDEALAELGRFFHLTRSQPSNSEMPMFSGFIDVAWHRMLDHPEQYEAFCRTHAGASIQHVELAGEGPVNWIAAYEKQFGALPDIWFADAEGVVDQGTLDTYRYTGNIATSWDCSPQKPDGDDSGVPTLRRDPDGLQYSPRSSGGSS